jgi:rRNA maturation endonuclease Nob1
MPLRYWYHCQSCNYRAYRYRNVKRCPDCGGNLIREEGGKPPQEWIEWNANSYS